MLQIQAFRYNLAYILFLLMTVTFFVIGNGVQLSTTCRPTGSVIIIVGASFLFGAGAFKTKDALLNDEPTLVRQQAIGY